MEFVGYECGSSDAIPGQALQCLAIQLWHDIWQRKAGVCSIYHGLPDRLPVGYMAFWCGEPDLTWPELTCFFLFFFCETSPHRYVDGEGVIKKATKGKLLWLRATGSTVISQILDSFVVSYVAFSLGTHNILYTHLHIF